MLKRRNFFISANDKKGKMAKSAEGEESLESEDEGESSEKDELLQFKLARIVFELAMKTLESAKEKKSEL